MHDLTIGSAILVYVADTYFYLFVFLHKFLQFDLINALNIQFL